MSAKVRATTGPCLAVSGLFIADNAGGLGVIPLFHRRVERQRQILIQPHDIGHGDEGRNQYLFALASGLGADCPHKSLAGDRRSHEAYSLTRDPNGFGNVDAPQGNDPGRQWEDGMEIFADPITVNCRKVLAGLKLMGLDYSLSKVDYFNAEKRAKPTWRSTPMRPCLR